MKTEQGVIHIAIPTNIKMYSFVYKDVALYSDTGGFYYYNTFKKNYVSSDYERIKAIYSTI